MKKALLLLFFAIIGITFPSFSQALGEAAVKEILVKKFNEQLPKVLGDGKIMKGLNLGVLKIRPGHLKIKGQTKWNLKLGKHNKPIRFKGTISTRFNNFGKPDLLINLPGDKFLFFRKYQRLSDLVNLKRLLKKEGN